MLTRIFQLIHDYSKTVWDISLKFSAYVHHMTALIWHKNFGYCLLGKTAAPSIKPKLWKSLAALFVEIFSKKILGGGFRPIWVTQWQEFEIFPQKWRFQIFQVALLSRWLQWFLYRVMPAKVMVSKIWKVTIFDIFTQVYVCNVGIYGTKMCLS